MERELSKSKKKKPKLTEEITSKGVYENGEIKLSGRKLPKKKMNVIVSFREEIDDEMKVKEDAIESFLKKWSGVIQTEDLAVVMENKLDYLIEKYK